MLKQGVLVAGILALTTCYATPVTSKDITVGEKVFKKCVSCHSLNKNKIGPSLENLFGRTAGTREGYRYSRAMKESEVVWDEETLKKFLEKPRKFIKGNKMRFSGIRKESKLDALIAYLKEATKIE